MPKRLTSAFRPGSQKYTELLEEFGELPRMNAKGAEQALLNYHGLARTGGSLENIRNSISPNNPIYNAEVARALQLLRQAGYKL